MGKYKKGILGYFRGKVGTVVGAVIRGIHYMRSLPDTTDNPTEAQLNVRAKMKLVVQFLTSIKVLINSGYQKVKKGESPMNAATGYHLKNAVTGIAPAYELDYPKVVFSVGELDEVNAPDVAVTVAAQVKFNWMANGVMEFGKPTDLATFLVYNPTKDRFVYVRGITPRSALTYNMMLPIDFSGDTIECWMGFTSADGKLVSNSTYVGTITVM